MTDFLTDHGVVVALACAGIAVIYGLVVTASLLKMSPGNKKMQDISRAIQEGASAYLTRQYLIIGLVAIPLVVVLFFLQNSATAIGFIIGGVLSGAAIFLGAAAWRTGLSLAPSRLAALAKLD